MYFFKWVLQSADQILYHAPIEKEKLTKLGIYNPARCSFIPIGSDGNFFKSAKLKNVKILENTIVSVGKDRARDYKTLIEAANQLPPQISFIVIARPNNLKGLEIPKNMTVHFDLPYEKVAQFYKMATAIVIPIKEMHRSSGQMTLVDCLQSSKPIIISDVEGIRHYPLVNGSSVILIPPQNPKSLKDAIERLLSDQKLQKRLIANTRVLASRYSTKNYARQLAQVISLTVDGLTLTPISQKDLEFLRVTRNLNNNFFLSNTANITKEEQKKWFQSYSKNLNDHMFILSRGSEKIGVGAIYNIDEKKKEAEIGRFVIVNSDRGKGYGKILLSKIEHLEKNQLGLKKLNLQVLAANKRAIELYVKAGFLKQEAKAVNGKKVIAMTKNLGVENW